MEREIGTTFVGPVQKESGKRISTHFFQLFSKGMPKPILLSYPTRIQALQARETLGMSEKSFLVPTTKLFDAITGLAADPACALPEAVVAPSWPFNAVLSSEPADDV